MARTAQAHLPASRQEVLLALSCALLLSANGRRTLRERPRVDALHDFPDGELLGIARRRRPVANMRLWGYVDRSISSWLSAGAAVRPGRFARSYRGRHDHRDWFPCNLVSELPDDLLIQARRRYSRWPFFRSFRRSASDHQRAHMHSFPSGTPPTSNCAASRYRMLLSSFENTFCIQPYINTALLSESKCA
ncbi:hypothetical protein K523DRAFT_99290 [Schizophyllum commune Tattone D]|nr:hypothetical protein K523DRAFT_99290 [Schizophyllum commune Tattone D]